MQLQSSAFLFGGTIPAKYTCDGDNISPPLTWDAPPSGTVSFVLIVEDPDAPTRNFTHWVAYDLPAQLRHLPENVGHQLYLPQGGMQGKNDFGQLGFGGPCPPKGTHHYFFKLYALNQLLELAPGASKTDILAASAGHILEQVELMGHYARQSSI